MPKALSRRELIRKLRAFGFEGPYSGKRHQFMERGNLRVRIPNPHQAYITVHLVVEIIRQAGIDSMQWDKA